MAHAFFIYYAHYKEPLPEWQASYDLDRYIGAVYRQPSESPPLYVRVGEGGDR